MSPTILPEIVRCNLGPMRDVLDASEASNLTPEQADELFFLCSFLADAIEKSWARIQGSTYNGVEGQKLSAMLKEVTDQIDDSLRTYERLQRLAGGIPDYRAAADNLSRLTEDTAKVEQVRRQVVSFRDWLNVPSPPVDLEHLRTLEAGPFVRLADLQTRRDSQIS